MGGCAGSTSCSVKVIRYVVLAKALGREIELAYRPTVVRVVRVNGEVVDPSIIRHVFFYVGLIAVIFLAGWLMMSLFEPDAAWTEAGGSIQQKHLDCASAVV